MQSETENELGSQMDVGCFPPKTVATDKIGEVGAQSLPMNAVLRWRQTHDLTDADRTCIKVNHTM